MSKLKSPLMAFGSRGTLGATLTFQRSRGQDIVRTKPIPANPRTLPQIYHRWDYIDYAYLWRILPVAEKRQWLSDACRYHITGFNFYMRTHLTALSNITVRLPLDYVSGGVTPDTSKNDLSCLVYGATPKKLVIDNGFYLDGNNDYMRVLDSLLTNIGLSDITFEWFSAGKRSALEIILSKSDNHYGALTQGYLITLRNDLSPKRISFSHTAAANRIEWNNIGNFLSDDVMRCWHLTLNRATGKAELFYDNTSLGTKTILNNSVDIKSTQQLYISRGAWAPYGFWRTDLDQFVMYHRILDSNERQRHVERHYP